MRFDQSDLDSGNRLKRPAVPARPARSSYSRLARIRRYEAMRPEELVRHTDEMRSIMTAFGRQQAAFADETFRYFIDVELTMVQVRALVTLRRSGRQTGRELAARLHVTPGTLVPLVDRLEEMGFARRVPDQDDRRLTWIELTPKADRFFQQMWSRGAGKMARAIGQLVPKDRAILRRILNQVADHLEVGQGPAQENKATA